MSLSLTSRRPRKRLLSDIVILILLGLCMAIVTISLWKVQESRSRAQILATAESKVRLYARETEARYATKYQALKRLASGGVPVGEAGADKWEEEAIFYVEAFEGFKSISWVDQAFRIRQIVPIRGNELYLGQLASSIEATPSVLHQWVPIVQEGTFEGFIVALIDLASFLSPVLLEIEGNYDLELTEDGVPILTSTDWQISPEDVRIRVTITLQDAAVLQMSLAPTASSLHSGVAGARRTLIFGLLLSAATLIAVYFARKYNGIAHLSELRYRGLFEASQDAIFIVDRKSGVYQDANPAALGMTGYSLEELRNLSTADLTLSEDVGSLPAPSLLWAKDGIAELFLRGKRGQAIPVELVVSPIIERGTQKRMLGIARDITERKRVEEQKLAMEVQLRQSQRLESIGTLASGVAHEINNPLMGIMNYAELSKDNVHNPETMKYLDEIGTEGNRIAVIVKNLLSFSRQGKEEHSPADIRDIINSSLSLVGSLLTKAQITLELDIPDDLPKVKCRSQQIEQVVINLLTNARDALNLRYPEYDEDKLLRVSVRRFEKSGEDWIRTTIEDHGAGIPADIADRIFDPFFTTKPRNEGTGLGLSVSFGIVTEHYGELSVEGVPGEGTRFHMDLRINNGWSHREMEDEDV